MVMCLAKKGARKMTFSKIMGIASAIAMSSSLAFAWSISGVVMTKNGMPLPGVKVNTFNIGGFETQEDED